MTIADSNRGAVTRVIANLRAAQRRKALKTDMMALRDHISSALSKAIADLIATERERGIQEHEISDAICHGFAHAMVHAVKLQVRDGAIGPALFALNHAAARQAYAIAAGIDTDVLPIAASRPAV
ncbi:hypothetical protein C7450_10337 [Chelatococcus asaccharovorans]|uniref:Uncharacterized protein n=2 Tax=Chelatococcus asaccharovorans TaxID=28210 RepID=A0A2V3UC47_9HYPH|nr:hypothetical protein C7450_10337 [Chelatococcus asaccharovorans]